MKLNPVCHCGHNTFPLEDPYSSKNNPDWKKCYEIGEKGPCTGEGQELVMDLIDGSSDLLKCSAGTDLVPFCTTCLPGNMCVGGQVKAFGTCQKGGRRSG